MSLQYAFIRKITISYALTKKTNSYVFAYIDHLKDGGFTLKNRKNSEKANENEAIFFNKKVLIINYLRIIIPVLRIVMFQ